MEAQVSGIGKGIPQSILGRWILGSPDYEDLGMDGGTHQVQNKFKKQINNVHLGGVYCQISLRVWAAIFERNKLVSKNLNSKSEKQVSGIRKGIPTQYQSILGRWILGSPDYEALGWMAALIRPKTNSF